MLAVRFQPRLKPEFKSTGEQFGHRQRTGRTFGKDVWVVQKLPMQTKGKGYIKRRGCLIQSNS